MQLPLYTIAGGYQIDDEGELQFPSGSYYAVRNVEGVRLIAIFSDRDLAESYFDNIDSSEELTLITCGIKELWRLAKRGIANGWEGFAIDPTPCDPTDDSQRTEVWEFQPMIDSIERHFRKIGEPLPAAAATDCLNN